MQSVKINKEKITDKGKDNMNTIQWGEPRPLRQRNDAIPFPLGALPPVLRDMVQAISVTTSTDVGMAGTAMLSSVGYCFTGLYRLAGKADHTEPPVLYSIIIAQPSERKSPVMHFIKAPFDSFESQTTFINKYGDSIFIAIPVKKYFIIQYKAVVHYYKVYFVEK